MKITVTPANSNNSYVFEGTLDELNAVVSRVFSNGATKDLKTSKPNVSDSKVSTNADDINKFIKSVYLFPADNATPTGKGRFIADILADFNPHTFSEIEKKANVVTKTVLRNIAKLRAAGAKINVNGQTIQLVEIPNKRYIAKRRKSPNTTNNAAFAAIAGMKLS